MKEKIKEWNRGNNSFTIGFIIVALIVVAIFFYFYSEDKPLLDKCLQEYKRDYNTGLYERSELFERFNKCFP